VAASTLGRQSSPADVDAAAAEAFVAREIPAREIPAREIVAMNRRRRPLRVGTDAVRASRGA